MEARQRDAVDGGPAVDGQRAGAAGAAGAARCGGPPGRRRLHVPRRARARRSLWADVARRLLVRARPRPRPRRAAHVSGRPHRRATCRSSATTAPSSVRPGSIRGMCCRPTPSSSVSSATRAVTARVRIAPERAALVEREVGGDRVVARRRNGAIEVAVPASQPAAFASWVLGLADHAEVLSPKVVRETFVARLRALATRRPATEQAVSPAPRRSERAAESRLSRLLVILPWLMERREVPLAEVAATFNDDARRGRCRARAGRDVRGAAVRRRADRRVHRRRDGVRRRASPVHQAAAADRARGLRSRHCRTGGDAAAGSRPGERPRPWAGQAGRGTRRGCRRRGPASSTWRRRRWSTSSSRRPSASNASGCDTGRRRATRSRIASSRPRRVFHERGEWYVAGDDHRSGEYRTFRIDRVESIEQTGEFDDPVDDDDDPGFIGVVVRRRLAAPRDGSFAAGGPVGRRGVSGGLRDRARRRSPRGPVRRRQ